MHATLPLMRRYDFPALRRTRLETLQVNLGYRCNQSCLHCHVNAGPNRSEMMSRETVADEVSGATRKASPVTSSPERENGIAQRPSVMSLPRRRNRMCPLGAYTGS